MKRLWQMTVYRLRVWAARHWADPQLAWLAQQYSAVLVTSERNGKLLFPIYHCLSDGGAIASLAEQLHEAIKERDYWKQQAGGEK